MRTPVGIYLLLGALILIWGSTWSAIVVGLEGIPPFAGIGIRFTVAGLLLWVIGRGLGLRRPRGPRVLRLWAIETVFGFMISYGVVYWAEDRGVPSGVAAVLFATFPIFVAILAHLFLEGEPLQSKGVLGMVVCAAGVALIFSDDLGALAGEGLRFKAPALLLAAMAGAVSHVAVKKWGGDIHPIHLATVPMLATGALMTGLALSLERQRGLDLDVRSVGALAYLIVMGTVVTFTLYYWLLARLPATRLSLITYGFPLVAIAIGTLLLDEPLSAPIVAGTALVLGGVKLAGATRVSSEAT